MKKRISALLAMCMVCTAISVPTAAESSEKVTLEFAQWWENELPEGKMAEIIANFEEQHPNIEIKLVTNPYSSTHDALVAGAATGVIPKRLIILIKNIR